MGAHGVMVHRRGHARGACANKATSGSNGGFVSATAAELKQPL
jgi:hypothetical protein